MKSDEITGMVFDIVRDSELSETSVQVDIGPSTEDLLKQYDMSTVRDLNETEKQIAKEAFLKGLTATTSPRSFDTKMGALLITSQNVNVGLRLASQALQSLPESQRSEASARLLSLCPCPPIPDP